MNKAIYIFLSLLLVNNLPALAQDPAIHMNLDQVISLARENSPQAKANKHKFRAAYWRYRSFRAGYLPQLSLISTLPDLSREISSITMPDGSEAFVERSYANSYGQLSLSQNISLTGGSLSLNSGLQRIDIFGDNENTSYLATPVRLTYQQPLFSFNSFKWEKRIEPVKYEEAKKLYIQDMEQLSLTAVRYFFELIMSQANYEIARVNKQLYDTLYVIAKGRYHSGNIAENELLEMELAMLNAGTAKIEAGLDLELKRFRLNSFLGLSNKEEIKLIPPRQIAFFQIPFDTARALALENNPEMLGLNRMLMESERDVDKTRSENQFNAELYASFGINNTTEELHMLYDRFQDQENFSVGLVIPILDWGVREGRYKMALSRQELVNAEYDQALIDFEQEIILIINQFNMQERRLEIATKADTVAGMRYDITRKRYINGKVTVTDINIASTERDKAIRNYYSTLYNYWLLYYQIRHLTLFDFQENSEIGVQFEELIE